MSVLMEAINGQMVPVQRTPAVVDPFEAKDGETLIRSASVNASGRMGESNFRLALFYVRGGRYRWVTHYGNINETLNHESADFGHVFDSVQRFLAHAAFMASVA